MKHVKHETKRAFTALDGFVAAVGFTEAFEALSGLVRDAAVFVVDHERNVLHWSDGAERLLGFTREEVVGRHCLSSNRCTECMAGCGIAERGYVEDAPLVLRRADGNTVRVRKTARAFFDASGRFGGGIEVLVRDPSPLARADEAPALPIPRGAHDDTVTFHGLVTRDPAMQRAFEMTRNAAETDATVLVRGESGTGKEHIARAIHAESRRSAGPFVAVNCAAFTPTLLESELFGHVRGAFTGATSDRSGLFRQAEGGTLFLDEVAELSPELQAKLLRVLQERTLVPVGGQRSVHVELRIVAATHRSLRDAVRVGRFREDLMYRLRVVPIFLPPLRERRGDVELLLWHFLERFNARGPRHVRSVSPEAMRSLLDHTWPGNVRELRNVVEYAFAVGRGPELTRDELPPELRDPRPPPVRPTREDDGTRVRRALAEAGGHIGRAAALLGVSRPTLWRMRKRLGI
jgi:PAS domain S-box-containing protein